MKFFSFVLSHFFQDDCPYRASALAFTSLLAIVPLAGISLSFLSAFPPFQQLKTPIQNFIFEHFVPETGKVIEAYLQQFIEQINELSLLGMIFLFVTALLSMITIEHSMNKIWKVKIHRRKIDAFLLYWTILTFLPILLGLSLTASISILSSSFLKGSLMSSISAHCLSFLVSLFGFSFLYAVVPNCTVKISHAFYGGLTASLLFFITKQGFVFYLSQYNFYELVYGAFSIIPLFFIWVYLIWFITLIGAEIAYALSVHWERT